MAGIASVATERRRNRAFVTTARQQVATLSRQLAEDGFTTFRYQSTRITIRKLESTLELLRLRFYLQLAEWSGGLQGKRGLAMECTGAQVFLGANY